MHVRTLTRDGASTLVYKPGREQGRKGTHRGAWSGPCSHACKCACMRGRLLVVFPPFAGSVPRGPRILTKCAEMLETRGPRRDNPTRVVSSGPRGRFTMGAPSPATDQ